MGRMLPGRPSTSLRVRVKDDGGDGGGAVVMMG
nr:hypothetical protein [Tanacetum cinerariifolium]